MSDTERLRHRNREMAAGRRAGQTFVALAARYGLSVQRVRDIVAREVARDANAESDAYRESAYREYVPVQPDPDSLDSDNFKYLSMRTLCALKNAGIRTVTELLEWSRRDLSMCRNIGSGALGEIDRMVAGRGIDWRNRDNGAGRWW